jgi:hypothetical protein
MRNSKQSVNRPQPLLLHSIDMKTQHISTQIKLYVTDNYEMAYNLLVPGVGARQLLPSFVNGRLALGNLA